MCGRGYDSVQGSVILKTVYAHETDKEGDKGLGTGQLFEWIHSHLPGIHWQGGKQHKGLGAKVVKHLTQPYINSCRHVYFDNFFTGVDLLDLERSQLYDCGSGATGKAFLQI